MEESVIMRVSIAPGQWWQLPGTDVQVMLPNGPLINLLFRKVTPEKPQVKK